MEKCEEKLVNVKIERMGKERKKERSYKEWKNVKIERIGKERKKEATKNGKM